MLPRSDGRKPGGGSDPPFLAWRIGNLSLTRAELWLVGDYGRTANPEYFLQQLHTRNAPNPTERNHHDRINRNLPRFKYAATLLGAFAILALAPATAHAQPVDGTTGGGGCTYTDKDGYPIPIDDGHPSSSTARPSPAAAERSPPPPRRRRTSATSECRSSRAPRCSAPALITAPSRSARHLSPRGGGPIL